MTAPNRVDELRKRYHENPRRFFAPLANEYRKTGFVDRAILLCEKHLSEQPGNMNGLVVYGQCLFETGRLDEARQPFEMALAVDPENLIALRHLGDIARLGGDAPKAREWYEKVLEFDRRNDEVIALLAEVGGGVDKPASASQAPNIVSVAGSVRVTTGTESLGMIDLEPSAPPVPEAAPPARASSSTPARPLAPTPIRPQPAVDPSARTVEVSAQPRPAKRASLLDVSFDFGEIGADPEPAPPPAPSPLLPSEAAEYGFAAPEPQAAPEDEIDSLDAFVSALPSSPSLIEAAPEGEPMGEIPEVEGIEKAEFSAEVSPLAGLESSEFEGGDAAPLEGLDPSEFQPPDRPSSLMEGLESDEFQPLGLEETSGPGLELTHDDPFGGDTSAATEDAATDAEDEAGAAHDARASIAGLPMLEPLGTPTPMDTPSVSDLPLLPSLEEVETVPIDLEAARRSMETPPTFVTETMAQVYVQQGHTDKAIEVYRQLIAQSPGDAGLRDRLRALESPPVESLLEIDDMFEAASATPGPEPLDLDLSAMDSAEPVDEPAPANAMLTATSFDGISLSVPATPSRAVTPVQTPAAAPVAAPMAAPIAAPIAAPAAAGPSAREFFARFAHRAATPSWTPSIEGAPTIGGKLMSPLDELFGTNVPSEDETAAHRLAGVGATSGPSGGSALDSLFGEGPSAPMPASTPSRGSVTRASEKLRFDQFFASSTPVEGSLSSPAPAAPAPAPESRTEPAEDPGAPEDGGQDDDLDQFQGWLRGLTS